MKKYFFHFFALLAFTLQAQNPNFNNGMVVSAHPEASKVGIEIMRKGGNAVDAAVSVEFALAVTLPIAGNIGGGGFMVYRGADGKYDALDYREKAPGHADRDMYLDNNKDPIKGLSLFGHLASGVPGTVDGMAKAHKKYGKLDWADVLQPAIDLAEKGFNITASQANEFNNNRENFLKWNPNGTAFTEKGNWKEGDILIQKELAETLKRIQKEGRAGFYEGKTAQLIVDEMKRGNGIITLDDLKNYQAVWRTPIIGNYKEYKIISMPPPSSGGIALTSLLTSVEGFPLKEWGFQHEKTIQVMVEAERRVYADRAEYLGDPDFFNVPIKHLTDRGHVLSRMESFSFNKATPSSEIKASKFQIKETAETTHYSIVDKEGNAVSATTTLNGAFGSYVVVEGGGFLMNNEMDDFSMKPGVPNLYGLTGGEANAIEPGKRMLSSMTPTIIEKNGKLFMVVGTPGGSTIITSVFQTFLNVVEFGMDMQEAVDAPRFHHQWLPDEVFLEEKAISKETREKLKDKGYNLVNKNPWGWTNGTWGRVDAILVNHDGSFQGGADPRGDDMALGF